MAYLLQGLIRLPQRCCMAGVSILPLKNSAPHVYPTRGSYHPHVNFLSLKSAGAGVQEYSK